MTKARAELLGRRFLASAHANTSLAVVFLAFKNY